MQERRERDTCQIRGISFSRQTRDRYIYQDASFVFLLSAGNESSRSVGLGHRYDLTIREQGHPLRIRGFGGRVCVRVGPVGSDRWGKMNEYVNIACRSRRLNASEIVE